MTVDWRRLHTRLYLDVVVYSNVVMRSNMPMYSNVVSGFREVGQSANGLARPPTVVSQ